MKKLLLLSFGTLALAISSCKNDLDVTDDYRETMVVYGLLNPNDTAQYIKINKAFLGRVSAYTMAAVYDSSNYVHGEITAKLERWLGGSIVQTIPLYKDSVLPKDAGLFPSPGQVLYKTTSVIQQDGSDYKLIITNNLSGKVVTSSTSIVNSPAVFNPSPLTTINFVGPQPFKTKWYTSAGGRLYNVTIRMHYLERYVNDTLQIANKYIDLTFTDVRTSSLHLTGPQELLEQIVDANTFYRNIRNSPQLDANLSKERFFQSLEFRYSAAAEDFATYMDVSGTLSASFGDHPTYSNIDGGVGLFSSRCLYIVPNVNLSSPSKDTLKNGQFTYNLRFQ